VKCHYQRADLRAKPVDASPTVTAIQRDMRMNRFSYYHIVTLMSVALLAACSVEAQTGGSSVTLRAAVSETVALSLLPNSPHNNIGMSIVSNGSSVGMTFSGTDTKPQVVRVPLIVRSNSSFRISATFESETALLTQLSVIDVRATGTLVSPLAISELDVSQHLDLRGLDQNGSLMSSSPLDVSRPLLVLSGPRVSLGGTLDSPNNALQITLLIRIKPQKGRGTSVHLRFVGDNDKRSEIGSSLEMNPLALIGELKNRVHCESAVQTERPRDRHIGSNRALTTVSAFNAASVISTVSPGGSFSLTKVKCIGVPELVPRGSCGDESQKYLFSSYEISFACNLIWQA
jgi:hypothetical protein